MLHPQLPDIIRRIRDRGMLAGLLTNGLLLSRKTIAQLNDSGLDHLQISIDNLVPNQVSKKSLRVLDKKLQLLAEHAGFNVSINSVMGEGMEQAEALEIATRAVELGFGSSVGILHDDGGQLAPLSRRHREIHAQINQLEKQLFRAASHNPFQENLVRGLPNDWHCHAGSRYLYICEDGLVHYCSQQRGHPGIPLARYTTEDLECEYHSVKECAPFCAVSCVHRVAWMDRLRTEPSRALKEFFPAPVGEEWTSAQLPWPVRALSRLFLSDPETRKPRWLSRAALRLLGIE